MSCMDIEPLSNYDGWVVIEKHRYNTSYQIIMQKENVIKTINSYEYYYERYNLGDTIKSEKR